MDALIIPRTPACSAHTFNGSIIALRKDGSFGTHFSSDIPDTVFVNLYRNGMMPRSPCNLSCKLIYPTGTSVFNIAYHVTQNDTKEDPRFFMYKGQLMMSYNKIIFAHTTTTNESEHNNPIDKVVVEACSLSSSFAMGLPMNIPVEFPLANWEKNWLFFEHEGELCIIYNLYPELVILNSFGKVLKREKWDHPCGANKWARFMSRNLKTFQKFCKVADLFHTPTDSAFEVRGGAHPVFLDGKYYMFAHTREHDGKFYRMVCVVMDGTLSVCGTTKPLLIPGYQNARIVYPVGAIFDTAKNIWYISCGLNDVQQLLVTFEHSWLLKQMIPIAKKNEMQ